MNEQEIFSAALEQNPQDRSAFLDSACGDDVALRQRIERLLDLAADRGSFLQKPAPEVLATEIPEVTEQPGTIIGPYKLREQIGEGGFGVVYVAEQEEPVSRKVALKIIKPGMDTKEVIARFEAERQALALMDHPNVARVLDAGATDSGRPYFVMELVRGVSITDFCDERKLSIRERLSLLVDVCRAVQHAHQKGIIHRDLKPSNVMVTLADGKPIVKVIDFGVSKALSQKLTELTIYTAYGQMVGTPMYMSPEQAEMTLHDVDTRSDVYSLGVLLYELLSGATPFDRETLQKSGFEEMRRIIREVEPPRPSVRVSTLRAQDLTTACGRRGIAPSKLSASLSGELDWIVMKALEKDRNRRYESASAFADDLERYLNDEPVQACPPSLGYRFRKFARRKKAALTTALVVSVAVLAGTGVSIWQAARATREANRATQEALRATGAEQLASARLEEVDEQRRIAVENFNEAEEQRRRAEANVQLAFDALERVYLPLAEAKLTGKTELSEQDRQFLEKALPFYETLAAQRADDPQAQYSRARACLRVGNIYQALRVHPDEKDAQAEQALRQTITLLEELAEQDPDSVEYQRVLAVAHRELGDLLQVREPQQSEAAYRRSIAVFEQVLTDLPAHERFLLAESYYHLGVSQCQRWGRIEESLEMFRKGLDVSERLLAESPGSRARQQQLIMALDGLATGCRKLGRAEEGEAYALRAVEECEQCASESDNIWFQAHLGIGLRILAEIQMQLNQPEQAEQSFLRGLPLVQAAVERDPQQMWIRVELANGNLESYAEFLESRQRFQEAVQIWRQAIELNDQLAIEWPHGAHRSDAIRHRGNLVIALKVLGRTEEAAEVIQAVDEEVAEDRFLRAVFYKSIVGAQHKVATQHEAEGRLQLARTFYDGQLEAARRYAESVGDGNPGDGPAETMHALWHLMKIAAKQEEPEAAIGYWDDLRIVTRELSPDDTRSTGVINMLARAISVLGIYDSTLQQQAPDRDLMTECQDLLALIPVDEIQSAEALNSLAWRLAVNPSDRLRGADLASELAQRAVNAEPDNPDYLNTLGVARYYRGDLDLAVQHLERAVTLPRGANAFNWFFLAMAHQQLGASKKAQANYELAITWMDQQAPDNSELLHFRSEAERLLGILSETESAEDGSTNGIEATEQ